jgi:endoglucanase
VDYDSADAWFQMIEDYNLSYAAWNISNKDESSALIRSDCDKTSGWKDDELSETGLWLKNTMQ